MPGRSRRTSPAKPLSLPSGDAVDAAWTALRHEWLAARPAAESDVPSILLSTLHTVLDHDEIVRLYGPWQALTPRDAANRFEGYSGRWWIAGGWAIEAFTGHQRRHDDLDPSIPRIDVAALRQHVSGRLDVWAADDGALRPLVGEDESISATCGNLWLLASGSDLWMYDVLLMDGTPTMWTYKRDARISLPVEEVLWIREDIPYLRLEVQLLHKSTGLRPKDQADFEACLHLLEPHPRDWLRWALDTAHPGHPWLARL